MTDHKYANELFRHNNTIYRFGDLHPTLQRKYLHLIEIRIATENRLAEKEQQAKTNYNKRLLEQILSKLNDEEKSVIYRLFIPLAS